ncbi:hypothetical protein QTJ16_003353 [Diplocarpon rosae]|uniref:Uncharacterized protein n=1 Tax=Diplocarpon rosae TaxID=946125 RepID=A0AAD9T1H9_9HELO|nr:hypothetical protein QTJ16_003353 [Diplocarpon rosae]
MGKGKGKAGRKEAKLAAKKLNQAPKIPGMPKPAQPQKKAKKIPSREKKSALNTNPPGPATYPLPMGRPKPFTKSPQHAKWPALFKKHLQVIEAHIKDLDRVMNSMKADMAMMSEKERLEMESGERGNWKAICGMMDRAREVLKNAKLAARGILPSRALRDRQNLGVLGSNFEPLAAQPEKNAVEPGYNPTEKGTLDQNSESVIGDENSGESDASDGSESEGEDDAVAQNTDFVTLNGAKHPRAAPLENSVSEARAGLHEAIPSRRKETTEVEPNPYFVVDVEPTPVVLDTPASGDPNKKSRKQTEAEATELRKAAKEARKQTCTAPEAAASAPPMEAAPPADSEVDFNALEAKLQAEIAAGTKAQEEAEASEKMLKKKRRRSSNGDEEVGEKKAKIEKLEKKKRKAEEGESVSEKKAKEKKGKKRKAEETAEVVEAEEASKKKRKHKDSA